LFAGTPGLQGIPDDNFSLTVMGVLIFIGGLGIPVVADIFLFVAPQAPSPFPAFPPDPACDRLFCFSGWLALFAAETQPGATLAELPTTARPGRFSLSVHFGAHGRVQRFDNFYDLAPSSQMLKISLMFIGTAPASMGGGITTSTLVVLLLALWAFARGREAPHIFGRSLGIRNLRRASAVLTISLAVSSASPGFC
jgi:trk system potassium uptake protein